MEPPVPLPPPTPPKPSREGQAGESFHTSLGPSLLCGDFLITELGVGLWAKKGKECREGGGKGEGRGAAGRRTHT